MILSPSELARFWPKIDVGDGAGCWLWTAGKDRAGYGRFGRSLSGGRWRGELAHRVMWAVAHGGWAPLFVCHNCNTPACVNPRHLREDTNAGNLGEAASLGRCHKFTRRTLTPEQVAWIRRCPTISHIVVVCDQLDIKEDIARHVWYRRTYKDLP